MDRGCVEDQPQKVETTANVGGSETYVTGSSFLRLVSDTAAVRLAKN
jgi:hypothetical protein